MSIPNNTEDTAALINRLQQDIANSNNGEDLNALFEQVARSLLHRVNAEVKTKIIYFSNISYKMLLYVYHRLLLFFILFDTWEIKRSTDMNSGSQIGVLDVIERDSQSTATSSISSVTLDKLDEQAEYYRSHLDKAPSEDTIRTIGVYMKNIFKDVKFLVDKGKDFDEPDFVSGHIDGLNEREGRPQKKQTVKIVEKLLGELGRVYMHIYISVQFLFTLLKKLITTIIDHFSH